MYCIAAVWPFVLSQLCVLCAMDDNNSKLTGRFDAAQRFSRFDAAQRLYDVQNDNVNANYVLGLHHKFGWATPMNRKLALEHFEKAAVCGHAGSCYELALEHRNAPDKAKDVIQQVTNHPEFWNDEFDLPGYSQMKYVQKLHDLFEVMHERHLNRTLWVPTAEFPTVESFKEAHPILPDLRKALGLKLSC